MNIVVIEGATAVSRIESVLKWCNGHKAMEPRGSFDRSAGRWDGLQTRCRVSNRAGWRLVTGRQAS